MKSKNFCNIFCLLIVFAFSLVAISCQEGLTEPTHIVLTTENYEKLQAAADKVMFYTPGLVAYISVEGEGELVITRGVSNLVTNEPMNINNYFRIASITKTFTTEAVLILADEGKIDIDKSISFYLPEYRIPSGDKITIRMLGNMTSGLFDYTGDVNFMLPFFQSSGEKILSPDSMVTVACRHPLNFEPGTKYQYCNTNTVMLGLVIKKVTGNSVSQVFTEKIFQPLGMANTYWPSSRYLPYPYTHGYSSVLGSLMDVTNWSPSQADAAGMLISNISDLRMWVKEIYDRNLLSTITKIERFKWVDEHNSGSPGQYFYGFGLMKFKDWIGHSGVIEGYNSQIYYNPVKKISIIISTNTQQGYPAEATFHFFADVLAP